MTTALLYQLIYKLQEARNVGELFIIFFYCGSNNYSHPNVGLSLTRNHIANTNFE